MYKLKCFDNHCCHYSDQDYGVVYDIFPAFSVVNGGKIFHMYTFVKLNLRLLSQFWELELKNMSCCVISKHNSMMDSKFVNSDFTLEGIF